MISSLSSLTRHGTPALEGKIAKGILLNHLGKSSIFLILNIGFVSASFYSVRGFLCFPKFLPQTIAIVLIIACFFQIT